VSAADLVSLAELQCFRCPEVAPVRVVALQGDHIWGWCSISCALADGWPWLNNERLPPRRRRARHQKFACATA
jgi:hypothetical protein